MRLGTSLVRTSILIAIVALTTRVLESKARAVVITVNGHSKVPNDGLCSFEEAVDSINRVPGGGDACPPEDNGTDDDWIYLPSGDDYVVNPGSTLSSSRTLILIGDGQDVSRIVIQGSGPNQGHGLNISGPVYIDDLTIEGSAGNHDIGIENSSSDLELFDVGITGFGSTAIENLSNNQVFGQVWISYSTIYGNGFGAAMGSGGAARNWGALSFMDSTISGNHGYYGGGIYNVGLLIADGSTFDGNVARFSGGGIYTGGAINMISARLELMNCTFANNSTTTGNALGSTSLGGGAIFWDGGGPPGGAYFEVSYITVANNQSQGAGGGLNVQSGGSGTVAYGAGLFANNLAAVGPDISGDMTFFAHPSLITSSSGITNLPSNWIVTSSPGLGAYGPGVQGTNVFPLLSNSPAIDASGDSSPLMDQNGTSRPIGAYNDIGAIEYSP